MTIDKTRIALGEQRLTNGNRAVFRCFEQTESTQPSNARLQKDFGIGCMDECIHGSRNVGSEVENLPRRPNGIGSRSRRRLAGAVDEVCEFCSKSYLAAGAL
jgi:hypothetical protein